MINVLMTGGGAPGASGILKCLKKQPHFNVIAADADENAIGRYLNDKFEQILPASHPDFIQNILKLCIDRNVQVLLPLVTRELFPLAQNKELFAANGIKILVSDYDSLSVANDKSKLYNFLKDRGIPVPNFEVVNTVEAFEKAVYKLGYPQKDVCFKPSVSNGSRGFRIISDKVNELDLLFNHKPNSVYMSLGDAIRILSMGSFPELLVSEVLPGEEYSIDCLVDKGKPILIVPRIRKKMIGGISVAGEFIKDDSIIDYCHEIILALKLHGNIGIQVKRSDKNKFLLLEINPRVQGTIVSTLGIGINLPVLAVKQELGIPIEKSALHIQWGIRFARFWDEIFY